LVIGGSGFLGRRVVTVARAAGWDVTATSFSAPTNEAPALLDLRQPEEVAALIGSVAPDAVVNTAYLQGGPDARAVNVDGAEAVALAAQRVGARLVHMSTDVVFDGTAGRPYTEADRHTPLSAYGQAKADAEAVVAAADPSAVLVRTSLIYRGPGGASPGEPSPHEAMAADPDATFYEDELRCPVQVDDLAAAVVELCGLDIAGPLNVAGPTAVSRRRFAELVTGGAVKGAPAPPGRPLDCRLDISLAAETLETEIRPVEEVWQRGDL